jgi:hypothetical protein
MTESPEVVLAVVFAVWAVIHPMLALWPSKPKRLSRITFRVGHQPGGVK